MKIELTRTNCIIDGIDLGAISCYTKETLKGGLLNISFKFINKIPKECIESLKINPQIIKAYSSELLLSIICHESELSESPISNPTNEIVEIELIS